MRTNPNGIASLSPGLERSDYPGFLFQDENNLNEVVAVCASKKTNRRNRVAVGDFSWTTTHGSACRATLGFETESRCDSEIEHVPIPPPDDCRQRHAYWIK